MTPCLAQLKRRLKRGERVITRVMRTLFSLVLAVGALLHNKETSAWDTCERTPESPGQNPDRKKYSGLRISGVGNTFLGVHRES